MPRISVADQEISYTDSGTGDAMLILPDNMHSFSAYESELTYFSNRFRVVSLDFPGVGKSTREILYQDEILLDLWEFRSDFAMHFLLELGIHNCYVLGFGLGSLSAIHFAGYHAKLHGFVAKGLICDSFLSHIDPRTLHKMLNRREHYYVRAAGQLEQEHGKDWRAVVDRDTAALRTVANQGGYTIPEYVLRSVPCPTLLTGSITDPVATDMIDDLSRVASLIPNCRLYLSTGSEHPFSWKEPTEYRTVVDLFLRQIQTEGK